MRQSSRQSRGALGLLPLSGLGERRPRRRQVPLARSTLAAHRGGRQAHHLNLHDEARGETSARSSTAPSSRTSIRTPCGSTTARCRLRRADRARPRPPRRRRPTPARHDPGLRARAARRRARHARRPRQEQGAQAPHHRRCARPRPQRPLRVRARARTRLRRRDLSRRPRLHIRPRLRATPRRRDRTGARGGLLRRRPPRRRWAPRRGGRGRAARAQAGARHAEATRSNLGIGHDICAGLIDPTDAQLRALTQIVCRLLVRPYRELIVYGAGWTDPERQHPVGDTGGHEPRQSRRLRP